MADNISFSLTGLQSLKAKLAQVSNDVKKKGGRAALRKAARFVVNDIKKRAEAFDDPTTVRSIKDNADLRWDNRLFRSTGNLGFRIGILGGANNNRPLVDAKKAPTPHWRYLEFGTEKTQARPFVRPALTENIDQVTEIFITEYEKALDKALQQAGQ